jgi:hypothetical protein|tara:strand:- start:2632 stop:2835 length:204 start_codon:yes stop_codon:yes gene_type:complete
MFKEVTSKYTFVQEEDGNIEVYESTGDISDLKPIFISNVKVDSQKQFEVEVAYILVYDIPNILPESL